MLNDGELVVELVHTILDKKYCFNGMYKNIAITPE